MLGFVGMAASSSLLAGNTTFVQFASFSESAWAVLHGLLARTLTRPAGNAKRAVKGWSGLHETPIDRGLLLELETQIAAI
jgi:hypothetical protein